MGCCGDSTDYNQSQRQVYEPPRPQRRQLQQYQAPRPRPQQADYERKRIQAHATQAARNYGWAGQNHQQGNRDSYLEPQLGPALVALPGSEFRELAPRPRPPYYHQHHHHHQPQPQPRPQPSNPAFPAAPKPSYRASSTQRRVPPPQPTRYRPSPQRPAMQQQHQQQQAPPRPGQPGVVRQQPARAQPMMMTTTTTTSSAPRRVEPRQPRAVLQPQAVAYHGGGRWRIEPEEEEEDEELVKRLSLDSNGVSVLSDDGLADGPARRMHHAISLSPISPREAMMDAGLYNHMGMGYGMRARVF